MVDLGYLNLSDYYLAGNFKLHVLSNLNVSLNCNTIMSLLNKYSLRFVLVTTILVRQTRLVYFFILYLSLKWTSNVSVVVQHRFLSGVGSTSPPFMSSTFLGYHIW